MTRPTRNAPIGVSLPVRKREIRTRSTALRLAVCLVACWLPALVSAQTDIWKGGTGNWTDATKWNNGVPTPTSNVFIDNGNPAASAVTVDTNPAQCNNLTIDGDDSLTVGNGQALYVGGSVVNNAGTLGVTAFSGYLFFSGSSPTISNAGTISLNAVSGGTVGLNVSGTATLKGAGNLTMTNAAGNYIMGPYQPSPGASLTNQTTIRGSGGIGGIAGIGAGNTFTNQATINANQTTPLIISNSTGQTFINTGTLEATNGAIMGLAGGTITNTGGIIHADPGSTVELQSGPTDGTTITGGTLTTSGTGVIQSTCCFNNGTLNGVTNNGTFKLIQTIENLNGTVTNNGSFQVNAAGFNTDLNVTGAVILKGTGSLTMSNDANNHIMGYGQTGPGASLLNQSTIQGGGSIGWNGGLGTGNSVTNQGSIFANVVTPLTIGVSTGSFTNTGTLKVKKGSAMYITGGGFSNFSGSTLTGGTYMVSGTLGFDGANILSNAASITLTGASAQIVNDLNSANALANFATNTTTGSFSLLSGKLLNTTVTSGNFSNAGKVTVGVGSGFQISAPSPLMPTYTQTAGTTTVDGVLTAAGGVTIQAGNLFGKGTIAAAVVSSGSVTAGDSLTKAGKLSPSAYTQNSHGTLNIPITGATVGTQYGQLAVANGVRLSGTLKIKRATTFVPAIGSVFTILTGSAVSGTFATVIGLSITSSEHFTIAYNATSVTLTVASGP